MHMLTSSIRPTVLALGAPSTLERARRAASDVDLELVAVSTLSELLRELRSRSWAATLLSLATDHVDEAVVRTVSERGDGGALILTAPGFSLERALLAERCGALALLREPIDEEELRRRLLLVLDEGPEVPLPPPDDGVSTDPRRGAPRLVGDSPRMGEVFQSIARVARSNATVLLTGESGTGKEVVARTLHWASDRSDGPFVAVNCAAIPENLLESELFGHERGAFTGAVARRVGRFERAHGGTLFLDEIGDMSLVLQAKVLRVLEDRIVERVGGEATGPIDVRVIAATNQELGVAREEGRFREDLFFRLAVVELALPPLRERAEDVRRLALHFAAHFAEEHAKPVRAITERALRRIEEAPWPGNVRELRNVMDRAVLLANGTTIREVDLRIGAAAPRTSAAGGSANGGGYEPTLSLEEVEADHIRRVLASVDGHNGRAATVLGIHRNTLARKMKQYGIAGAAGDA